MSGGEGGGVMAWQSGDTPLYHMKAGNHDALLTRCQDIFPAVLVATKLDNIGKTLGQFAARTGYF